MEELSKFADAYVTAGSQDSGNATVDKIFASAITIAEPIHNLEEKKVILVKDAGPSTDKVVFTVIKPTNLTFTNVDTRGSEVVTRNEYQAITAPHYVEVTPVTKSSTVFMFDNLNLINPVNFQDYMKQLGEATKKSKIVSAMTTLVTLSNYTVATSVKMANGYASYTTVNSTHTLQPDDLNSASIDLKKGDTPIIADVCVLNSSQSQQLENNADFSPGQLTNANYKKARFDADGRLVSFNKMEIIELLDQEYPAITTGSFTASNGHFAIIGKKGVILGRGENNKKNKTSRDRKNSQHGDELTIDINYADKVLYADGIRLIACTD